MNALLIYLNFCLLKNRSTKLFVQNCIKLKYLIILGEKKKTASIEKLSSNNNKQINSKTILNKLQSN